MCVHNNRTDSVSLCVRACVNVLSICSTGDFLCIAPSTKTQQASYFNTLEWFTVILCITLISVGGMWCTALYTEPIYSRLIKLSDLHYFGELYKPRNSREHILSIRFSHRFISRMLFRFIKRLIQVNSVWMLCVCVCLLAVSFLNATQYRTHNFLTYTFCTKCSRTEAIKTELVAQSRRRHCILSREAL